MITYVACYIAMICTAPFIKRQATAMVFISILALFVAFRGKTGFDWPVYEIIFKELSVSFSITQMVLFQLLYNQEPAFLATLGILSQVLPNYQYAQIAFSIFFFASTLSLCKTFRIRNIALVYALIFSYLLLTVGFSTVRQTIAISFFNFGLSAWLGNRKYKSYFLFFCAANFQYSALLYIVSLLGAIMMQRFKIAITFSNFTMIAVGLFFSIGIIIGLLSSLSAYFSARFAFYADSGSAQGIGILAIPVIILFSSIGWHVTQTTPRAKDQTSEVILLRSMILILSAICVAAIYLPIIRDRASYELWILYCVYLGTYYAPHKWPARFLAYTFGAAFSFLIVLAYPTVLAFVPYQNSLLLYILNQNSTGAARQAIMFNELDR